MPTVYRLNTALLDKLVPQLAWLSDEQRRTVIPAAINRTGARVYTQVVRAVAKRSGAQQKRVRKILVERKAYDGRLAYTITARDQYMSLKDFKPSQQTRGVSVTSLDSQRKVLPHTFIGPGGHVYVRGGPKVVMTKGRYAGKMRQRIHKLFGPALPKIMVQEYVSRIVEATVAGALPRELASQFDRAMAKAKAVR